MTFTTLIPQARAALTNYSALTAVVEANKITFARRPQGDLKPGITLEVGAVDYNPVMGTNEGEIRYRIDYNAFSESAEQAAQIHDLIKEAINNASPADYTLTFFDEAYFVDVDDIHRTTLMVDFIKFA